MENNYRHKIIIDPVHGDIGLSELETKIIDTPTFQRLRRLKQLGLASMVYPNADHSRFAHSIGVLHIMGCVAEIIEEKLKNKNDIQKLRIAGLLHDIGHYPYSHLMEYIDWNKYASEYLVKKGEKNLSHDTKVDNYPSHDDLAKLIVTERDDIKNVLNKYGIDPEEIARLIKGTHQDIPNLLHKSLDVDRLDYLVRDSLHTGVPYGRIDIHYILNNLSPTEKEEIVLNWKARTAAEHLLLARYFMFNTVYLHKTVFGLEEVFRKIILLLIDRNEIYSTGSSIRQIVSKKPSNFLDFHDGYLDKFIDKYVARKKDMLQVLCEVIKFRKPPKLIHEEIDLLEQKASEKYILFKHCMKQDLKDIADKCSINQENLIWREPKDVRFEALNPLVSVSRAKDTEEEELRQLVRIQESSGSITNLLTDPKSIIHYLSSRTLKMIRLYAVGVNKGQIEKLKGEVEKRLRL